MTATEKHPAVRVRFAPSPTGHFHIGGARTALFNWLYARKNSGSFVVRIEDTDAERSKPEFASEIFEALQWLGLDYDEGLAKGAYGPYRQSERAATYRKYLEQLLSHGHAYYCYCSKEDLEAERQALSAQGLPPKYGGHCRNLSEPPAGKSPQAIRFKIGEGVIEFDDMVRGRVGFDVGLFGDIIIAKDLDTALYNFAVTVDDELMQITHVIRGEDHIANTPKQLLMQRALSFKTPIYAHIPLILNPDRSKMSKRFSETSLLGYRDAGYLPDALVNFLALLGWHPKDDREVLSRDELITEFDLKRVQKAGAVFNQEKLDWLNREYIKKLDAQTIVSYIAPMFATVNATEVQLGKIVEMQRDRAKTLKDFMTESAFIFALPDYDPKLLIWKNDSLERTKEIFEKLSTLIEHLPDANRDTWPMTLEPLVSEYGRGSVYWPFRVALSGLAASPDPIAIASVLGKDEALRRIKLAQEKLK